MVEYRRRIVCRTEFPDVDDPAKHRHGVVTVRGQAQQICSQRRPRGALADPEDHPVGGLVEVPGDLLPHDLLGGDAEGVGVSSDSWSEEPYGIVLLAQLGRGRDGRVVVGEGSFEALDGGQQVYGVGVGERVRSPSPTTWR